MSPRALVRVAFAVTAFASLPIDGAIVVTQNSNAAALAAAFFGGGSGITVTGATLAGNSSNGAVSSGTYALSGPLPDTYTLSVNGVVLGTGDVADYGTAANSTPCTFDNYVCLSYDYFEAASASQEALLDPITGGIYDHYDVTQLDIDFDVSGGVSTIYFRLVFASEEYPIYVGSQFVDGFGLYLNGTNYAFVQAQPININHPNMVGVAGTELNGVILDAGSPAFTVALPVTPGSTGNVLTFIVADTSDEILDSAIFIASLGAVQPPGTIFLSSFEDPCATGWSGEAGFVADPGCAGAPVRETFHFAPRQPLPHRELPAGHTTVDAHRRGTEMP